MGGAQTPNADINGNNLQAMTYLLYADPSGNSGIIRGDNTSTGNINGINVINSANDTWNMSLGLTSAQIAPAGQYGTIVPSNFPASITTTTMPVYLLQTGGFWNNNSYSSATYPIADPGYSISLSNTNSSFESANITGAPWGIWSMTNAGSYNTGTSPFSYPTNYWTISFRLSSGTDLASGTTFPTMAEIYTFGTQWSQSNGAGTETLAATHAGYYADTTSAPSTGIYVGELKGTFNPNNFTWQALSMGVWMETNTLLNAACPGGTCQTTVAGLSAAQQNMLKLGIPVVEVGNATFTQAGGPVNGISGLTMSNVIFLSTNSGAAPVIWGTGNVSGTYSGTPNSLTSVPLTSNVGLTGNFIPAQWNNNKWLAGITGGGIYTGTGGWPGSSTTTINLRGAGAGTYTGTTSGSFTGSAAGIFPPR